MIGCYDFCGHYEWTFDWLEKTGGHALVRDYWTEAINHDSQRHARDLIQREGFDGMAKYWGHTLAEESPERGFALTPKPGVFRIDVHACPWSVCPLAHARSHDQSNTRRGLFPYASNAHHAQK